MSYKCDHISQAVAIEDKGLFLVRNVYYAEDYDHTHWTDDEYSGHIYGNFDRYGRGGYGDRSDMNSAIGRGFDVDVGEVTEFDDEYENALLMCLLESSVEEIDEYFQELVEGGQIEVEAGEVTPYVEQLSLIIDLARDDWVHSSYPNIPSGLVDRAEARAKELVEKSILARVTGDDFAIAVSFSGNYAEYISATPSVSLLDLGRGDGVWVPSEALRNELKKLPRPEAMRKASEYAESYCETMSMIAQGDVYDVDIKVYKLAFDEDGEPIEEESHYEDEGELLTEEGCSWCLGSEDAEEYAKDIETGLISHAFEILSKPSGPQMSLSM